MQEEEQNSQSYILPGQTVQMTFQPATEQEIVEFMKDLPPWFTREMLRPGVPIEMPSDDSTTVILPDGALREARPGAWDEKNSPKQRSFIARLLRRKRKD